MLIVLFRSELTGEAGDDYAQWADEMLEHARRQPGFVDFTQYTGKTNGERLTVVRWKDEETLEAWRRDRKHVAAKELGRERWYASYAIEIAKVFHTSSFDRLAADAGEPVASEETS